MSFTPGPWKCVSTADGIYGIYVAKDTKEFTPLADTCQLYLPIEECLGNARIMAAAPEMLELLRKAWLEIDNALLTYIPVGEDGNDMAELLREIETIIDRIDREEGNE